jgi:hypothetical protein
MVGSGYVANGSEEEIQFALEKKFASCVPDRDTPYEYVLTCTKKPSGTRLAWKLFRLIDTTAISEKEVDEIHSQFTVFLCRKSLGKPIVTKEHTAILQELRPAQGENSC